MSVPRLAFTGDEVPNRAGLMVTFRTGSKWVREYIEHGETMFDVILLDGEGKAGGSATVIAVHFISLDRVTDEMLRLDCNNPGRSWGSLYDELVDRYSTAEIASRNRPVDPTSLVSVVYFVRK